MQTIYWHDYETFGVNPAQDRPAQFAGLRTTLDLESVGEPLMLYCQPIADMLPSVDACLLTGISPELAMRHGLPEYQFMDRIHAEFAQPQTCGAGYNSIRFDDEVTRYSLYRNFFDPYAREWKNGNSRWDIIDMVRLTHALRPDGIQWPKSESGATSFKLERLSEANGLLHEAAHDALSDVKATIELARLIRNKQPRLYEFCWELKNKHKVASKIDFESHRPLFHVSSKIPASRHCSTLVMPLCLQPGNKNAVVTLDLCQSPDALIELNEDEIRERLYTPTNLLADNAERIPIKSIHLNRSPVVLPLSVLDRQTAERLGIDLALCEQRWQRLLSTPGLIEKICKVFESDYAREMDADAALYQGFLSDADRRLADQVRTASVDQLKSQVFLFEDARMNELLNRYRARHFPDSLPVAELELWCEQVGDKYMEAGDDGSSLLRRYEADLESRLSHEGLGDKDRQILTELRAWANAFAQKFGRPI